MSEERISDALLWVSHPEMMLERLGGMRVLERQLFTLARAGIKRVWVSAPYPKHVRKENLRWPEGLEVRWIEIAAEADTPCQPPYVGVSADHVIRRGALEAILAAPHKKQTSYQDANGRGVVQVLPYRTENMERYDRLPMPADSCMLLHNPPDRGPALPWLLSEARKSQDSFMARHFDRRISLAVTRLLLDTPVRPNHMTVFSSLVGVAGAALMLGGTRAWLVAGALVVWLHTLLDGCDGELARLRFQESRLGGVLDFWGDNVVHAALFSCLGVGLAKASGRAVFLALGLAAAASALVSAWLVFRHSLERAKASGPLFRGLEDLAAQGGARGWLAKVEHMLTQRDFVYLLVALAIAGRMELFLWAAGIGSPLFLTVLTYLRRQPA